MAPLHVPAPRSASGRWQQALCLLLLALALLGVVAAHVSWVGSNAAPPREDDNMQLMKSLQFEQGMVASGPHVLEPLLLGTAVDFYPPVTYAVTFAFYHVFGISEQAGRWSLLPFAILFAASLFGIGNRLWGPWAGLAAALAGVTSPTFVHYSHSYFVDVPLTAVVTFNLYALLLARDFEDEYGTLLWGLSMALGLMTKWTFLAWVAIPNLLALRALFRRDARMVGLTLAVLLNVAMGLLLWRMNKPFLRPHTIQPMVVGLYLGVFTALALGLAAVQRRLDSPASSRGFPWAVLLASCLALPWYVENVGSLRAGTRMMGELMGTYTLAMKLQCNINALRDMVCLLPVMLLAGLTWGLSHRDVRRNTAWVALCGLGAFTAMTLLLPFAARYIMPVLPYVVLVAFCWVEALRRLAPLAIACLLPIFAWQVAGNLPSAEALFPAPFRSVAETCLPAPPPPPDGRAYYVDEVLDRISATRGDSETAVVWVMNNRDQNLVQARVYEYFAMRRHLPVTILHVEPDDLPGLEPERRRLLARGTHMLLVTARDTPRQAWMKLATTHEGWKVEALGTYDLPQGHTALLFRREPPKKTEKPADAEKQGSPS